MTALSFSTDDFRPEERGEVWGEQIWSALGRFKTKVEGEFNGAVQFGDLGAIKLCNITVGPHEIERTPALIRRDDRGLLKVVFQVSGRCELEQGGRQLVLSPGEWTLYDASRPYRVHNSTPVGLLALLVPRDQLIDRRLDASRYGLQRLSFTAGLGRIICNFARLLLEDTPALSPASGSSLTESTVELVRLAILEHFCAYTVLPASAMLNERIRAYINRHLHDPRFSIDMIASAMKCSKRYLHKTFRSSDATLGQYIWNLRLDRCRSDLLDPRLAGRSITEIAFCWGFNNAAHFSRAFKARFGITARDCRASASSSSGIASFTRGQAEPIAR